MSLETLRQAADLINRCRDMIVWYIPDSRAKDAEFLKLLDDIDKFDRAVAVEHNSQ